MLSLVERLKSSEARLASLSEVEQKMEKFEKKEKADAKRIADLEYALSIQVGLHRSEVEELEKKLDEVTENFNVEQAKHEISDIEWLRVQKNVEELCHAKEECYNVAMKCCNKLKNSFAKFGAFSTDQNFIHGDPDGIIIWIGGEDKAFDEILSDRGDFCAFTDARGAVSLLEKAGCKHAKAVIQPDFSVSASDIKDPLAEAIALNGKFYYEVWLKGGREIEDEAIRQNEI
jgi:flavin-binding protein dodecin